jgi:hypothetical protein
MVVGRRTKLSSNKHKAWLSTHLEYNRRNNVLHAVAAAAIAFLIMRFFIPQFVAGKPAAEPSNAALIFLAASVLWAVGNACQALCHAYEAEFDNTAGKVSLTRTGAFRSRHRVVPYANVASLRVEPLERKDSSDKSAVYLSTGNGNRIKLTPANLKPETAAAAVDALCAWSGLPHADRVREAGGPSAKTVNHLAARPPAAPREPGYFERFGANWHEDQHRITMDFTPDKRSNVANYIYFAGSGSLVAYMSSALFVSGSWQGLCLIAFVPLALAYRIFIALEMRLVEFDAGLRQMIITSANDWRSKRAVIPFADVAHIGIWVGKDDSDDPNDTFQMYVSVKAKDITLSRDHEAEGRCKAKVARIAALTGWKVQNHRV